MTENKTDNASQDRPGNDSSPRDREGTISTDQLFRGRDEVLIQHGCDTYRLRITRTGKLILHK